MTSKERFGNIHNPVCSGFKEKAGLCPIDFFQKPGTWQEHRPQTTGWKSRHPQTALLLSVFSSKHKRSHMGSDSEVSTLTGICFPSQTTLPRTVQMKIPIGGHPMLHWNPHSLFSGWRNTCIFKKGKERTSNRMQQTMSR